MQATYLYNVVIQVPQGVTTDALAQALTTASNDGSLNASAYEPFAHGCMACSLVIVMSSELPMQSMAGRLLGWLMKVLLLMQPTQPGPRPAHPH